MNVEPLYQGSKDVFLVGVRAAFDSVEDQALKSTRALADWSLIGTDGNMQTLFTKVSNITSEGDRDVWRHIGTTDVEKNGTRRAGTTYPEASFLRTYETAVFDPDEQTANEFLVPEERDVKEAKMYKSVLNRAQKLLYGIDRQNVADIFEIFNLAFTIPTSYPTRFFAKGNKGLDGNYTALNEYLISIQHALANGGTAVSNAVTGSGLSLAFTDSVYYTAKEQGASITDDVAKPMPMFGGMVTLVVPPSNGLVRLAQEINKSEWKTSTAMNDINVLNGLMVSIKSSPYLLKSSYISTVANTKAWFMVDEGIRDPEVGTGLVAIDFVPLQTKVRRDEKIDSIAYTVKQEKVFGWVDWRNIMGSNGLGTAYIV